MAIALSGDAQDLLRGPRVGPAVLFVHGSGGHHAAWWQQVAALSPSYSVITVDLRGFGNSRWESDHDARNFPGDIIAVLDAVANDGGPQRAVLVGQSIGAAAALRAALDRPDRAAGVILGALARRAAARRADRAGEGGPGAGRAASGARPAAHAGVPGAAARPGVPVPADGHVQHGQDAGPAEPEQRRPDGARNWRARRSRCLLLAGEKDAVLSPATVRRAGELLPIGSGRGCDRRAALDVLGDARRCSTTRWRASSRTSRRRSTALTEDGGSLGVLQAS